MRQTKQNGRKRFRKKSTRRLRKKRAMKGGGCDSVDKPGTFTFSKTDEQKICHGDLDFIETIETFDKLLISWKTETDSANFGKIKAMLEIIRSKFTAESSNKIDGIPECFFKLVDKCIDNLITSIDEVDLTKYNEQIVNTRYSVVRFSEIRNILTLFKTQQVKNSKDLQSKNKTEFEKLKKECETRLNQVSLAQTSGQTTNDSNPQSQSP